MSQSHIVPTFKRELPWVAPGKASQCPLPCGTYTQATYMGVGDRLRTLKCSEFFEITWPAYEGLAVRGAETHRI